MNITAHFATYGEAAQYCRERDAYYSELEKKRLDEEARRESRLLR